VSQYSYSSGLLSRTMRALSPILAVLSHPGKSEGNNLQGSSSCRKYSLMILEYLFLACLRKVRFSTLFGTRSSARDNSFDTTYEGCLR